MLAGTMSVWIDGEYKEIGRVTEVRRNSSVYDEYPRIGHREPFRVLKENVVNYKVSLDNPVGLKMIEGSENRFKIGKSIIRAFAKSWNLYMGTHEAIMELELVVLEETVEDTPVKIQRDLEGFGTDVNKEFQEDLV